MKPIPIRAVCNNDRFESLAEIRLSQPLRALGASGKFQQLLRVGDFNTSWTDSPGIFLSYRLHPSPHDWAKIDHKCREGWLFIHDVDDHPKYLKGQQASKFRSIQLAHAVTVASPELVKVCKEWNPNVYLIPNQIQDLAPEKHFSTPSSPRVFLGALNRKPEVLEIIKETFSFFEEHPEIEFIFLTDDHHSNQLNIPNIKTLPLQNYSNYINLLRSSDIAFIPLEDNEFNRSKSDLKIIECLANGVVPMTTPFAAQQSSVPNDFLTICHNANDWQTQLKNLTNDMSLLTEKKLKGREYIALHRMWHMHAKSLGELYTSLFANQSTLEKTRQARSTLFFERHKSW